MTKQDPAQSGRNRRPPVHNHGEENVRETHGWNQERWRKMHANVEHVHGPEEVAYGMDELVVLCLVRDGRPYLRSFMEHYSSMGVKHLVFLDNGSTDGTVETLKTYENVTVLRTELPYRGNQGLMKGYLMKRFGQRRWSLLVDIDELFDYPYSDVVGLNSLFGYLNSNSYTAVVAHMLDMFPEKPLSGRAGNLDEPLKESHRFYDLSDLIRRKITEDSRCPPDNTYGSDDIALFSGGIRLAVFGNRTLLTKHPLIFQDDKVRPMAGPHWCGGARVADFTGVLLHYKFLDGLLRKQAEQAEIRTGGGPARYQKYLEVLEKTPSLSVKKDTSRELNDVNELVGTQFMTVSRQYMSFVESEAQRNGHHSEESHSERLLEAFFNAKAEVTAQAEQLETMRKQNQRLQRQNEKRRWKV